jgi:hypothetical protein
MAIFIGRKNNSGQVSVYREVYGGSVLLLRQHLALLLGKGWVAMEEKMYQTPSMTADKDFWEDKWLW